MGNGLNGFYEVAVGARAVYVRVHGLASMNNCLCIRDFLHDMVDSGRRFLVLDMIECTGMDSTFMGVIAGVVAREDDHHQVGLAVINAGKALVRLLESVGLAELIFVDPKACPPPDAEFYLLEEQACEEDRLQLIHTAHHHLIDICAANEKIFGDLLDTIEEEMKARGMLP